MTEEVSFTLDISDYTAFNRLHLLRQGRRLLLVSLLAVTAISMLGAVISGDLGDVFLPIAVGLAAGGIIWLIYYWILLPIQARKILNETVFLKEVQHWTTIEGGLLAKQTSGEARILWENIVSWDEDQNSFVLYANRMLGYVFPKGKVDADFIDMMRAAVAGSGLPNKGKRRK